MDRIEAAEERGTLPYFIRDNRKDVEEVLRGYSTEEAVSEEEIKERKRIEANRREYERLFADPNYNDVEFNPENGGLKATHVGHEKHENDKTLYFGKLSSSELEERAQDILYRNGHLCIFESEIVYGDNGNMVRSLDTTTDGERVDIKSITKNGKNTIKNAIRDKKAQLREFNEIYGTDYHSLILYFYDKSMFDEGKIRNLLGSTFEKFICLIEPNSIVIIE